MKKLAATLTAGAFVLSACGGGKTADPASKSSDDHMKVACTSSGTALKVAAKDMKFDQACLAVKAGEAFTIDLDNQDDFPHNVSIYRTKDDKERLYEGKPFAEGMKTVTYSAPAIAEKGTFHFMCDIHPEMEGTFVVD